MLSVVSRMPEVVALYPRQIELENAISKIVHQQKGVKETDLWLMAMAEMAHVPNPPPLCIVAGTVQRMLQRGKLISIDYVISDCAYSFILPPGIRPMISVPVRIQRPHSILHSVD